MILCRQNFGRAVCMVNFMFGRVRNTAIMEWVLECGQAWVIINRFCNPICKFFFANIFIFDPVRTPKSQPFSSHLTKTNTMRCSRHIARGGVGMDANCVVCIAGRGSSPIAQSESSLQSCSRLTKSAVSHTSWLKSGCIKRWKLSSIENCFMFCFMQLNSTSFVRSYIKHRI